jgi:hypothetical protein
MTKKNFSPTKLQNNIFFFSKYKDEGIFLSQTKFSYMTQNVHLNAH